jgi:hypothetical protein
VVRWEAGARGVWGRGRSGCGSYREREGAHPVRLTRGSRAHARQPRTRVHGAESGAGCGVGQGSWGELVRRGVPAEGEVRSLPL